MKANLTKREIEIFKLVTKGLENHSIAEELNIREHTVKTHLRNLYAKTKVQSRSELIASLQNSCEKPSGMWKA